jgi:hypothetical protein
MKNGFICEPTQRILVTGSRGKSSIVRLLHAAMLAADHECYARITGVIPRQLGPNGVRVISRSSGAHVGEMHWWLRQLPASARAIIMENSAITPDLQGLAGRWLKPGITILSNTLPDHQELWGPSRASAARVLTAGIPRTCPVVLPDKLQSDQHLLALLRERQCPLVFAGPVACVEQHHHATNMGLALTALEHLGIAGVPALQSMLQLRPDRYDFHIASYGGARLAMAFAVNDIFSTKTLFRSLSWSREETRLIYNHRSDRPGRFQSFVDWLGNSRWREVLIIGDRPRARPGSARYVKLNNTQGLLRLFQPGDRIFGCGNIAGLPLSLTALEQFK